ncbi:MAG: ParB N-terminal domain-containing protein [Stagnimonas sp.]|nr:ParB N-terminal domain-containing protein [Stagnimonas sp.]
MSSPVAVEAPRVVEASLSDIVRLQDLQARDGLDGPTVKQYVSVIEQGRKMPPLEVSRVDGRLYLVDGFHRYAALDSLGLAVVGVVIHDDTWTKACARAAQANTAHGLRLKPREVRAQLGLFVRGALHRDPKGNLKSFRVIAAELGGAVHHNSIRGWIIKDFPKIAAKMRAPDREWKPGDNPRATQGPRTAIPV